MRPSATRGLHHPEMLKLHKDLQMTHGEKWVRRKNALKVTDDARNHYSGLTKRSGPKHMTHYKLKTWAAFAMDGVITGQDSFDAVETFSRHCELNGYVNTLRTAV
jgi:hypothetical protein